MPDPHSSVPCSGQGGQRQKRISVRHYFVFLARQRQAWGCGLGAGMVGGRGWQRQKRISGRHYFLVARGSGRQGWGWGWGQGGQRQKRISVRHYFVFAGTAAILAQLTRCA